MTRYEVQKTNNLAKIQKLAKRLNKFTVEDISILSSLGKDTITDLLTELEEDKIVKRLSENEYLYSKVRIESIETIIKDIDDDANEKQDSNEIKFTGEWETLEKVAKKLSCKRETLRRKCKSGEIESKFETDGKYKHYLIKVDTIPENLISNGTKRNQLKKINFNATFTPEKFKKLSLRNNEERKFYENQPPYSQKLILKYLTLLKLTQNVRGKELRRLIDEIGKYHPELKTSYSNLAKKKNDYTKNGIKALACKYGNTEGKSKTPTEMYDDFKKLYLNPQCLTMNKVIDLLEKKGYSPLLIPSRATFRRLLAKEYTKEYIESIRHTPVEYPNLNEFRIPKDKIKNSITKQTYEYFIDGANERLKKLKYQKTERALSRIGYLKNHIIPYFKDFKFKDITQKDIILFQSKKLSEGFSTASIQIFLSELSKLISTYCDSELNLHYGKGYATLSPIETRVLKNSKILSLKKSNCPELWVLALGLNVGEVGALNYEDINFENKTVTISKILFNNSVQTHRRANRIRTLELPECILKLLDKNKTGRIFENVNIENFDILMNTHIKLMLDHNVSLNIIYKRLGYQNIRELESRYDFLIPQKLDDDFDIFSNL